MRGIKDFCPLLMAVIFFSCSQREPARARNVLGTLCSINAFEDGTKRLYDEAFDLLSAIEGEFSTRIETSDVSRINSQAGISPVRAGGNVIYVLKKALFYAELSDGDFDPTVGVLVDLWGIGTEGQGIPPQKEIEAALPLVDWRDVRIDDEAGTVFLARKGMRLDLGGIAKGFAADCLRDLLGQRNVRRAVINLGGNVYVLGSKKDGSPWTIGIKDPCDEPGSPALAVRIPGSGTVVTSGSYERFFEQDGIRYHHIINPRTGFPAESDTLSASVIAPSSCDADALSTIAFIQGREGFSRTLGKLGGPDETETGCVFMEKGGRVHASANLSGKIYACKEEFSGIDFFRP